MADDINDTVEVPAIQVAGAAGAPGAAHAGDLSTDSTAAEGVIERADVAEVLGAEVLGAGAGFGDEAEAGSGDGAEGDGDAGAPVDDAFFEARLTQAVTAATAAFAAEAAAAQAEAEEWRNKALRAAAEHDNARKRMQREREETRKTAAESLLKDVLPILDNLDRAVEHAGNASGPLVEGVKMVVRQFLQTLDRHGAKPVEAKGQPFDPHVHEAMSAITTTEFPPGHVAQVFQRGWTLHDRLVRPAMVLVAQAPEPAATPAPADGDAAEATDDAAHDGAEDAVVLGGSGNGEG